jgi:hypothetical protein
VSNTGGDFTPAPVGLHRAVCCDVVELGMIETKFGKKEKIEIAWQIDELMEDGNRFKVIKWYNKTLHPEGNLCKDLESWRGRAFTEQEVSGFDLEKLLGANCQLNVVHKTTDRGTFANVSAVLPAAKGEAKMEPLDYTRKCDRDDYQGPKTEPSEEPADPGSYKAKIEGALNRAHEGVDQSRLEDDIPF